MKNRIIASASVALFAALALTGCVTANTETADGSYADATTKAGSCEIIVSDLTEYTAQLAEGDGLSDYTPSTMLSFQQGAVDKLTTISEKIEHEGVKDALVKVRDTASELIPILERINESPDIYTDGSIQGEIDTANKNAADALAELGELCPAVVGVAP